MVLIGERLGLFKALAEGGPATSDELAKRTGTSERYVREWLAAQAAAGYIEYSKATRRFSMTPEQAMALADENSPVYIAAAFDVIKSGYIDEPKVTNAFKTGQGVGWHEHHECLFRGVERFFRSGYQAHLVQEWIPALDGVAAKLKRGARVADVGCGHGASTLLMAKAFPGSTFVGFDYHKESIERARKAAAEAGIANATFEVAKAKDFPGRDYDLVACFDALHDMGDPKGAAAHIRKALKPDGTFMLVEPFAHDDLADNLNPVGRVYYSGSTMICTPASLAQEVGLGLGAQAGETRLREVVTSAGFTCCRRAPETPFNLILEARP
jgi:2-polyprenyl-3-methyl-5-hydroxy-6-metoxy-1,4-benzoquinol methylase